LPSGDVVPCVFARWEAMRVGNVLESPLADVLDGGSFRSVHEALGQAFALRADAAAQSPVQACDPDHDCPPGMCAPNYICGPHSRQGQTSWSPCAPDLCSPQLSCNPGDSCPPNGHKLGRPPGAALDRVAGFGSSPGRGQLGLAGVAKEEEI
jgi:hypothetical protein